LEGRAGDVEILPLVTHAVPAAVRWANRTTPDYRKRPGQEKKLSGKKGRYPDPHAKEAPFPQFRRKTQTERLLYLGFWWLE